MSSSQSLWTFCNQSNPNEIIEIHDQASANALKELIKRSGGNWQIKEEIKATRSSGKTGIHKVPPPLTAVPARPTQERRTQKRYMTEFRVILISGSHSFRTISQDVSLGGMKLKKSIPANFLQNSCIAYISHKDLNENLEMVCNVIADPSDPCRIQFHKPDPTQLNRLNEWLIEQNTKPLSAKSR